MKGESLVVNTRWTRRVLWGNARNALAATLAAAGLTEGAWAAAPVADDPWLNSVSGGPGPLPEGYAAPMIANGSLCLLIDPQGCQVQQPYARMTPGIWWAGRRYGPCGPAQEQLVPFGHFEQSISAGGTGWTAPESWTQALDTRHAEVTCRAVYGSALSVETVAFAPLEQDLVVVHKRISAGNPNLRSARFTFRYRFTSPGNDNRPPRRMECAGRWDEAERSALFEYRLDGHRPSQGVVSVFCDKPVTAVLDGQSVELSAEVALDPAQPAALTFCLGFADSLDGKGERERAAGLRRLAREQGFEGLRRSHRQAWADYGSQSQVRLPDARLQRVYCTAQYHLRANATRWSFPVGIFPTHWAGKYFGWDEMFCYQALVSSGHFDIARRCPEFRFAGLPKAIDRASHYGKPGAYGARYPWETLEDGSEGAPPGFWMDHVFHMSNIATSCWYHYLYTHDLAYLKGKGYPVIRECARFFLANMVYETPDGGMFLGKCTDLERLGPARLNPYMTACGAIYTLEAAAAAAELTGLDAGERAAWKNASAKLRASLPHEAGRFVPHPGCSEPSIASLGGLFPYPVWDETNERQRNAAAHFLQHGRASGNMYPVGNSVCAWYAGWMAAAFAVLGDRAEPVKLLSEAAERCGAFGELFEINEEKVSMRPWFSTASGNVVYAVNQMLVQSRGREIRIAPGTPADWNDFGFKLACHGDVSVEAEARAGHLVSLRLVPGERAGEQLRSLLVPADLLEGVELNRSVVESSAREGDCVRIEVRVKGPAALIAGPR